MQCQSTMLQLTLSLSHMMPRNFGTASPLSGTEKMTPLMTSAWKPWCPSRRNSRLSASIMNPMNMQYGFVEGLSTDVASTLAHDVISHCCYFGSPVYTCSLDAAGAFDCIPHPILFRQCYDVIPYDLWLLLVLVRTSVCAHQVGQTIEQFHQSAARNQTRWPNLTLSFQCLLQRHDWDPEQHGLWHLHCRNQVQCLLLKNWRRPPDKKIRRLSGLESTGEWGSSVEWIIWQG